MAQKQFKIGLSNTDKQNMAQDVYERVLALTFAEYDSANTYNEGDFVVYDDTLYQCKQDNTTGAWDSSKWQQATLQDLLNDIEGAVAFVNDKANVDGNYPTMTVGAADNLTPYDEDSGVDQEQPFLLQGTGCGNGEQQVDTGALGLLKEKQGNTVVVNQKVLDANRTFTSNVADTRASISFYVQTRIDGNYVNTSLIGVSITATGLYIGKFTAASNADAIRYKHNGSSNDIIMLSQNTNIVAGHTYLVMVNFTGVDVQTVGGVTAKDISFIDLTQWFGSSDNIPAHLLAHPEDFFRYYQGSLAYNEGALVNANGRYLKAIGRNQWDEVAEQGRIVFSTGEDASGNGLRSKNYIKVIPNQVYHQRIGTYDGGTSVVICFYDKDKNFVKSEEDLINGNFTVPSNACYIRFSVYTSSAVTYNNDITISIYYEGESGYDEYYPYEELANIDTGTETLRSAGAAHDSKAPDGTITRRVGTQDLSQLSWSLDEGDGYWFWRATWIAGQKVYTGGATQRDCISNNYQASSQNNIGLKDNEVSWGENTLYIRTNDKTTQPSGTLFYALEEPTTEQGTTFSENVAIDDFGSMDFGGTNGVPQGASIFYAVDYKAFIDSLYNTLDGDATDIVKESELDSKLATLGYVKLTSVSGYDATKTQTLKNVEGTLTWVTEE